MRKRKFEPGEYDLAVKRSKTGLGLFTFTPIKKGSCILEYVGREISEEEKISSRGKYLFEINSKKTIDGSAKTNKARYINHSCLPNCEAEVWKSRAYIMAKKNIKAGEELNYDYDKEYFDAYIKKHGCRCIKCHK